MRSSVMFVAMCGTTLSIAQQHTTFPNVDAYFEYTEWCALPQGGGYLWTTPYSYSFQPVIEVDSLNWSAIDGDYGLVAVAGDRINYRGDQFLAQDSTLLLYDFSLEVGDTAYFDQYMYYDHAVVMIIDTLTFGSQQRLRFFLNNEDIWIQGIGSLMGFFRPL